MRMELKKIKISNSRFFYFPHNGKENQWTLTFGKVLNKMEKDTPFISADSFCEIMVLAPTTFLVGKSVVGPIRGDISDLFLADFKIGEIEMMEITDCDITFSEIFEKAQKIISERSDLKGIFSIRIHQKDPFLHPMELRFFPNVYPFPKLTI